MMARVTVCLEESERAVLQQMSELDCRPPRDQIRYLVREEANRRGLFNSNERETKNLAVPGDKAHKNDQNSDL